MAFALPILFLFFSISSQADETESLKSLKLGLCHASIENHLGGFYSPKGKPQKGSISNIKRTIYPKDYFYKKRIRRKKSPPSFHQFHRVPKLLTQLLSSETIDIELLKTLGHYCSIPGVENYYCKDLQEIHSFFVSSESFQRELQNHLNYLRQEAKEIRIAARSYARTCRLEHSVKGPLIVGLSGERSIFGKATIIKLRKREKIDPEMAIPKYHCSKKSSHVSAQFTKLFEKCMANTPLARDSHQHDGALQYRDPLGFNPLILE